MVYKNRLTEKHYNGKGYYMLCSGVLRCDGKCGDCDELDKLVDRLGEFEDKAENTVEVVRCKDYKHHDRCEMEDLLRFFDCIENPYCAAGERRSDG